MKTSSLRILFALAAMLLGANAFAQSITVSGNFFTLLKEIASVGEDLKFNPFALGSSRCGSPSVLIKEMTIAGK